MSKFLNLLSVKLDFNKSIEDRFIKIMEDVKPKKEPDKDGTIYWGIGNEIYLIEFPKVKELYCDIRIWNVFRNEYCMSDIDITFFISKMLHKHYSTHQMCFFTPYHPHYRVNKNNTNQVSSNILLL